MESLKAAFFEASNNTLLEAVSFGASFALCISTQHLFMLNSRVATSVMPWAALAAAAALAAITFLGETEPLSRRRKCAAGCLAAFALASCAFALGFLPALRAACFVVLVAAGCALVVCDASRLSALGPRPAALGMAFGAAVGLVVLLALAGTGIALGIAGNVSNFTLYCMAADIVLVAAWVICQALIHRSEANRDAASQQPSDGLATKAGEAAASDVPNEKGTQAEKAMRAEKAAPGQGRAPGPARLRGRAAKAAEGLAISAGLLAPCAGGAGTAFFDGFTFNPFIRDVIGMDLARFALVAAGCLLLMTLVGRFAKKQLFRTVTSAAAFFFAVGILGMTTLAISGPSAETAGSIMVSTAHVLLALCGLCIACDYASSHPRISVFCMAATVFCCESPAFPAMGIGAKHVLGYDIATLTPLVIGAVTVLSLASIVANAHAINRMDELRESFAAQYAEGMAHREMELSEERRTKALTRAIGEAPVSKREQEVALWAMMGITNKEIATRMNISEKTVAFHLSNFYKKTGISGKAALVNLGYDGDEHE